VSQSFSQAASTADSSQSVSATTSKVARKLVPFLLTLYFFAYLDRFNVGIASLTMNKDLGLSMAAYGFAASMFFVGYILFEVPSNIVLGKVGARYWIARIMISWGVLSSAMVLVQGETSMAVLRFLLGVAEAGFFPGIVVYLTQWFPRSTRAGALGMFAVAMPLAGVIGSPISALILNYTHNLLGMQGWKWLFLLEGLPSVLLGIACLWFLPSRPADAKWLSATEQSSLQAVLEAERKETEAVHKFSLMEGFTTPRVLILALLLFCLICGSSGSGFFLPQVIKDFGLGTVQVGIVTAIPYLLAAIATVWWSSQADRHNGGIRYVAIPAAFSAIGFLIAATSLQTPIIAVIGLSMACMGIFATFPVFFTVPQTFMTGVAAAAAIAFINSFGNISGIVLPGFIGWTHDVSGGFAMMLYILSGIFIFAVFLCWCFSAIHRQQQAADNRQQVIASR